MTAIAAATLRLPRAGVWMALTAGVAAALTLYLDTALSIVSIWNRSQTYAHGYLIVPVCVWLIWRSRQTLAGLAPQPYWPALPLLAGLGMAWLLAEFAGVQVVRQYAFVAMVPLIVLAITGVQVTRVLAFPLGFLLLAVPFGDIFIGPLVNFTADFTVAALQMTGIPVLRNGTTFDIPTGSWSVVEACSGLRYLISSFTLGCLYAYLTYRSFARRVAFILLSVVVPIIANGFRAYFIVLIGHYSGNKLAAGVDHLIYGWLFFGLVMVVMFAIGRLWHEQGGPPPTASARKAAPEPVTPPRMPVRLAITTTSVVACVAIWPLYAALANEQSAAPESSGMTESATWEKTSAFTDWRPGYPAAETELRRFYRTGQNPVGVIVRFYTAPAHTTRLVSLENRVLAGEDTSWRQLSTAVRAEVINGQQWTIRESTMQNGAEQLLVWQCYWIDGHFTANDYVAKLMQAKQKLLLQRSHGAALFMFTRADAASGDGRRVLRRYLNENADWLNAQLAGKKQQ